MLFAVGLIMRLPFLSLPRQVVFDEIYFCEFATQYCCGHKNFFDIHPPHAKLLIAASAKVFGHKSDIQYKNIGQQLDESVAIEGMRLVPAFAGAAIPSIIFLLVYMLGGSVLSAFLAGFAICFDNSFIVQSRIVALDPILIFFMLTSVLTCLRVMRSDIKMDRYFWIALSGMFSAMAVGSKFTGLTAVAISFGLLGMTAIDKIYANSKMWLDQTKNFAAEMIVFVCGFAVVYLGGWYLHFFLLTETGSGDAFMLNTGHFFQDTFKLHKIMLSANAGITTPHPYASPWYTWFYLKRPIFYWQEAGKVIYFIGNPVVWFSVLPGFVYAVFYWYRNSTSWKERIFDRNLIMILGAIASIAPMAAVNRPLFLYHYLPTLTFLCIVTFSSFPNWSQSISPKRKKLYQGLAVIYVTLILIGFAIISPLSFGFHAGGSVRSYLQSLYTSWR
ncbi:MAG: phospholipid carrier-dependent glycosyltransferase [Proteobacteria bacterium]|nr:phospholipid carrier-dependent glycosyltransferase [Pseudomonadota bacterium]